MPDATITIRAAIAADIPALAAFAAHNFAQTFTHYAPEDLHAHLKKTCSEAYFTSALNTHSTRTLVAMDGEQLIGYTMVGKVMLPASEPPVAACEIYRLYADRRYHGKGLGAALLTSALALPQVRVAPAVYLSVWSENLKALRFYAKHGFAQIGEYLYPVGAHLDQEMILCRYA